MHRTLKAEACRPPRKHQATLQSAFNVFVDGYNNIWAYESLANETPASVHHVSTRPMPTTVTLPTYPSTFTVGVVKGDGDIKWRNERIDLSEVLAHEPVGLNQVADELLHGGLQVVADSLRHAARCMNERTSVEKAPLVLSRIEPDDVDSARRQSHQKQRGLHPVECDAIDFGGALDASRPTQ
jgi:hypothetical protein